MNIKNDKLAPHPSEGQNATISPDDIFSSKVLIPGYKPIGENDLSSLKSTEELHQKALERSRAQKDRAYSKNRDLFWCSFYNPGENRFETGVRLHIIKNEYDFPNRSAYNNQYVYIEKTETLFYIAQNQEEKVQLFDLGRFKKELEEIMNSGDDKFLTKHLNYDEIKKLITLNGGHSPHSIHVPISPEENRIMQIN